MDATSTGTFSVRKWDETLSLDLGGDAKITRASIEQAFEGDLRATSNAELLMHYSDEDTATITGFQRFEGSVDGREGTFLARFEGHYDGTTATAQLTLVPGAGTGAFTHLRGRGTAVAGHEPPGTYELQLTDE